MDFKILWIDDEPTWVESTQISIEAHIRKHGFIPKITYHEDGEKIDDYIFDADIDMIIIDYNLDEKESKSGAHLIDHIRKKGNFLEIVFYSQDQNAVMNKIGPHIEHIHCVPREDLSDKVESLVDYSKHKYEDCGYMRGVVIEEAIDMENLLEEIMVKSFGERGAQFRNRVLEKYVYDFNKKYMYVKSLLNASHDTIKKNSDKTVDEEGKQNALKECRATMNKFVDEVIEMRNILAHAPKKWGADGQLQLIGLNKKEKQIDVSREWMMETRSVLAKYRGALNQIIEENLLL
jgi:hypothetical protein